eukprot:tig00001333_g8190.t1
MERLPPKIIFRVSLNRQSKHKILGPEHKHCGGQEAYEVYTCSDVVVDVHRAGDAPEAPEDPPEFELLLATEPFSGPPASGQLPRYEEHIVEPERRRGNDGEGEEILPLERKPRRCGRVARFRSPPAGQAISIPLAINVVSFKHNNVLYRIVVCGECGAGNGRTVRRLYGVLDRPVRSVSKEIKRKGAAGPAGPVEAAVPTPVPRALTSGSEAGGPGSARDDEAGPAAARQPKQGTGGAGGGAGGGLEPPELHPVSSASSSSSTPRPSRRPGLGRRRRGGAGGPRRNARRATAVAGMRRIEREAASGPDGEEDEAAASARPAKPRPAAPARPAPPRRPAARRLRPTALLAAAAPAAPCAPLSRPARLVSSAPARAQEGDAAPGFAAAVKAEREEAEAGAGARSGPRAGRGALGGDTAIAQLEQERQRSVAAFTCEIERWHRAAVASEGRRRELEERLVERAEEVRQLREAHADEARRADRLRLELDSAKDEEDVGGALGKRKGPPSPARLSEGLILLSALAARPDPAAPDAHPAAPAPAPAEDHAAPAQGTPAPGPDALAAAL